MRKLALFFFGVTIALLVAAGLVVLSSASLTSGVRHYGDAYFFIKRQIVYLVIGVLLAAVVSAVDYRIWREHLWLNWAFFIVIFLALLAVFTPLGLKVNGSFRWIKLGPVNFQPAEFAKLSVVLLIAAWMDRIGYKVETLSKGFVVPMLIVTAAVTPIFRQPDFGSVMVVGMASGVVLCAAGTRWRYLLLLCLGGGGTLVYKVMHNANRMARIAAWLGVKIDVGTDVTDAAAANATHQAHMALVALKNGGLWGVGLGQSMQKQYYLPEAHTDFIFAIGAEELGLLFTLFTVILFLAFFALSLYIAIKASDRFGRYLVVGMAFLVFFQAMFNLGVVCEAAPTKGMALPFFSYGGTNLLGAFFAVGTILSVGIHSYREKKHALMRKVFTRS